MEIDLTTQLGNLELKSPIIVGSCPMTTSDLQRISMISNGAGALVLPSLYAGANQDASKACLDAEHQTVDDYLKLVESISSLESVPIIASLNGDMSDQWGEIPAQLESAGAAAIELSLRIVGSTNMEPRNIENEIIALTQSVDDKVDIPVFLKLTRNFTNVSHFAKRLRPHVQGLVLFGRSPVVDIELDSLTLSTRWGLTQAGSIVQSLESLMRTREVFPQMPLVACGGVGTSVDLIKALVAGANAAMVTSALYRSGPGVIGMLKDGLTKFMSDQSIGSIAQLHSLCPSMSDVQLEIETTGYQPTVDHDAQANSMNLENAIQCDRFGHPKAAN